MAIILSNLSRFSKFVHWKILLIHARSQRVLGGSEDPPLQRQKLLILDCTSSVFCFLFPPTIV